MLSRRPIQTLANFWGKKIRVFGTPLRVDLMKLLGAAPVPMAFGEVLALQNGTIDGLLADPRAAIIDTGARIGREAPQFSRAMIDKGNQDRQANRGQILRLPPAERAKMLADRLK